MVQIHLEGILTEDGRLLPDHPIALSPGRVKITINPIEDSVPNPTGSITHEEMKRRLAAAGFLADTSFIPDDLVRPDIPSFTPPPGAKTTDELIDEDRGPR